MKARLMLYPPQVGGIDGHKAVETEWHFQGDGIGSHASETLDCRAHPIPLKSSHGSHLDGVDAKRVSREVRAINRSSQPSAYEWEVCFHERYRSPCCLHASACAFSEIEREPSGAERSRAEWCRCKLVYVRTHEPYVAPSARRHACVHKCERMQLDVASIWSATSICGHV